MGWVISVQHSFNGLFTCFAQNWKDMNKTKSKFTRINTMHVQCIPRTAAHWTGRQLAGLPWHVNFLWPSSVSTRVSSLGTLLGAFCKCIVVHDSDKGVFLSEDFVDSLYLYPKLRLYNLAFCSIVSAVKIIVANI